MPRIKQFWLISLYSLLSLIFFSCITDDSNHTGGEYLLDQGITSDLSISRLQFPGVTADSFWFQPPSKTEVGGNFLIVGNWKNFESTARLAFILDSGSVFLDSLGTYDNLELLLTLDTINSQYLERVYQQAQKDSTRFVIQSFVKTYDKDYNSFEFTAIKNQEGKKFIQDFDSLTYWPDWEKITDTVTIPLKFIPDSVVKLTPTLTGLKSLLLQPSPPPPSRMILLQISSLDSLGTMIRFSGNQNKNNITSPNLVTVQKDSALSKHPRLTTIAMPSNRKGFSHHYSYTGPQQALISGMRQSLGITISRDTIINRIRSGLEGKLPEENKIEDFDFTWFVTLAEAKIGISDSGKVMEDSVLIDFSTFSSLDSAFGNNSITIDTGQTTMGFLEIDQAGRITDSIKLLYKIPESSSPQLIFDRTEGRDDTLKLEMDTPVGYNLPLSNTKVLKLTVTAKPGQAEIVSLVSLQSRREATGTRTPGNDSFDNSPENNPWRLVGPSSDSLTFRTTLGIQQLLYRSEIKKNNKSVSFSVSPSGGVTNSDSLQLTTPVYAVLPVHLENGQLKMDLTVHLFQLRKFK